MVDRDVPQDERHPIAAGLIALVSVGLVVGLIFGLAVMVGTRVLGVGGEEAAAQGTGEQSMYLPKPERTTGSNGPQITLAPAPSQSGQTSEPSESESTEAPDREISLSASQTQVAPMEQIDLTGVYPGGEGAILQVQRFTSGSWQDFPVTASVSDETFSTYVQTSQAGPNRFRVIDTDTRLTSNEVKVIVGG